MIKRCHKCQKIYDTEEYFCKNCGSILYDEKTEETQESAQNTEDAISQQKAENQQQNKVNPLSDDSDVSKESGLLMKQLETLRKYVLSGSFRVCAILVIAAVACSSVFEAFTQFATFTVQGETLTPYIASQIAFIIALRAFYTLLPAISMYKISMESENYKPGNDGAFVWRAGKALTYIMAYFIIQTVIACGTIGFVLNASVISVLSGERLMSVLLLGGTIVASIMILPYYIGGLVTFGSAKGCLKKAMPITLKGAKLFGVFSLIISIISSLVLAFSAVVFAVVNLSDMTLPGTSLIAGLFSKMSKTYLVYIFIMIIRSAADIVISVGFLRFIKKLKKVNYEK